MPSVNLYESTVPFSEKVSTVTPTHPTVMSNYSEFNFKDFATRVFAQFNELNTKIEPIGNRISDINESISDHHAIINELEREISLIANKLSSLHDKSSVPVPSSAESNINCIPSSPNHIYTFLPPHESPAPSSQSNSRQPSSPPSRHHPTPSRTPPPPSRSHPLPSRSHPPPPTLILHPPTLILANPVLTLLRPNLLNLCLALIHPHPALIIRSPALALTRRVLFIQPIPILPRPVPVLSRGVTIPLHLVHAHPRDLIPVRLVLIHPALLTLHHIVVMLSVDLHLILSLIALFHLYLVLPFHLIAHLLVPQVPLHPFVSRCWCWVTAIRNISGFPTQGITGSPPTLLRRLIPACV